jgi:hypothetical protein
MVRATADLADEETLQGLAHRARGRRAARSDFDAALREGGGDRAVVHLVHALVRLDALPPDLEALEGDDAVAALVERGEELGLLPQLSAPSLR